MSSGPKGLRIEWLPGAAALWVARTRVGAEVGAGVEMGACLEGTVQEGVPRLGET